jgi:hypothetical protein
MYYRRIWLAYELQMMCFKNQQRPADCFDSSFIQIARELTDLDAALTTMVEW